MKITSMELSFRRISLIRLCTRLFLIRHGRSCASASVLPCLFNTWPNKTILCRSVANAAKKVMRANFAECDCLFAVNRIQFIHARNVVECLTTCRRADDQQWHIWPWTTSNAFLVTRFMNVLAELYIILTSFPRFSSLWFCCFAFESRHPCASASDQWRATWRDDTSVYGTLPVRRWLLCMLQLLQMPRWQIAAHSDARTVEHGPQDDATSPVIFRINTAKIRRPLLPRMVRDSKMRAASQWLNMGGLLSIDKACM